jgi:membrane protein
MKEFAMAVRVDREPVGHLPTQPRITNPRLRPPRVARTALTSRRRQVVTSLPRWFYRGYQDANAGDLASAIAFNALIALVPISLLLFSLAGLFLRDDKVLVEAVHASVWAFTPQRTHQAIVAILEARRNTGWYGGISLLGFAWVGTNFISCLARSVNRVYGVRNRRFVHQRLRDFVVITIFAVLFLAAAVASTVPTLFVNHRSNAFFERWRIASTEYQIISYGVSLLAAAALFLVLYRVVPNAGQRLRNVWPGTLTAAVLFVVLVQMFPLYFRVFGTIDRYDKAFGFVSLLVAWFYFLSHVLLFGAYVNATYLRHCRQGTIINGHFLPGCDRPETPPASSWRRKLPKRLRDFAS